MPYTMLQRSSWRVSAQLACARALLRREDAVCAIRVPPQLGEMQIFECKPCGLVVATEALRSSVQPLLERRYYY
jgi:hypothetical protein